MIQSVELGELRSIRLNLLSGAVVALLLVGGVGVWASTTELAGAVLASGTIVVESSVKKVQHLTGGIVAELFVRDGKKVSVGDVLVRLDDTVLRANLAIVTKGIDDMTARKARLESERDGLDEIALPAELLSRMGLPDVGHAAAGERKLFDSRRSARTGQKSQLRERIAQLNQEIRGQAALQEAKTEEIEWIKKELDGVRGLWDKNLVQLTRLAALSREAARLKGELAQSISSTAQSRGKISEIEQQIIQIDQDLVSEVARELREVDSKIGEYVERKVAAEDQLKRVEIRSPQDGVVHQLSIHTVGGVVAPGDPIMLIVPEADRLSVEAKVSPQDIDQLHIGQPANLRFSAFNQRTTPEITGTVSKISADVTADSRNGQNYYTIGVSLTPAEIERLGAVKLVPGMPVEIFARTYDRTVVSYFVKPLHDQVARAFRER
jgi:HlyD family secretion protein